MTNLRSALGTPGPGPLRPPAGRKRFEPKGRFGPIGLAVMICAHIVIGYALFTGLAQRAYEIVNPPVVATIIQELQPPPAPPPPPPPRPTIARRQAAAAVVPPPFVPPPEVAAPSPAPDAITAVQSAQPVEQPPAAPVQPPAPPAAKPSPDIAVTCPKQVAPKVPRRAVDDGISGTVRAELHIVAGKVVATKILSGPAIFHDAVRAAVAGYECLATDGEVVATQNFIFKVE